MLEYEVSSPETDSARIIPTARVPCHVRFAFPRHGVLVHLSCFVHDRICVKAEGFSSSSSLPGAKRAQETATANNRRHRTNSSYYNL